MADSSSTATDVVDAGTTAGGQQQAGTGEQSGGNDREARYRVERNEARAEVERLSGVVQGLQRAAVEAALGDDITTKAWWMCRGEAGLDGLLTDDGTVDPEAVKAAVEVAITDLGLGPRRPGVDPTQGQNHVEDAVDAGQAWRGAFGPKVDG